MAVITTKIPTTPALVAIPAATLLAKKNTKKAINSGPFKLDIKGGSKYTYKSDNSSIAYVADGKVYPNSVGKTKVRVKSGSKEFVATIHITKRTSKPHIGQAAGKGNSGGVTTSDLWNRNHNYTQWDHVFRFKDPGKAIAAAKAMKATARNNNVTYSNVSKDRSMSFTREVRKKNWNPSKVKKKCQTACSQLVLTIVQIVGYHRKDTDYAYSDAYHAINKLKKGSHFYQKTSKDYTEKWTKLKAGDILIDSKPKDGDEGRHAVMIVD